MRIALDGFGSDRAPESEIMGAIAAAESSKDLEIIITGDKTILKNAINAVKKNNRRVSGIKIVHASERITMEDSPSSIVRNKKNSSLRVAYELVQNKEADAVISAGNSGASLAIAMLVFKRIKGIDRPAIATVMPSVGGYTVLIDAGANVDVKPHHLAQFAIMGAEYTAFMKDIKNPKIGILSNGEESSKGNELTREAYKIIQNTDLNFYGYVEGREIFNGRVDVVVCDGFTGNVILKASESLAEMIFNLLREEINKNFMAKIGFFMAKKSLKKFKKLVDHNEYGGAPLLGVNGAAFIAHGGASARAVTSAILVAKHFVEKGINSNIGCKIEANANNISH
ncbi:phosphate acyltransferase PlsX [Candidatus Acidulodesulfobacterium sp. H_13]|uniref:phosphate acyltransferase PlsX n=1 Tax=Candidatus Acidulodesulfobacterium sp. H_13 TaxID=3395470 RepID=UPI003AF83A2B